jgi:citrate synthase
MGYTTRDDIFVRDRNLTKDILGKLDFVDMIYFTATGEVPSEQVKRMTNVIIVTATDHGLTPSAISARMTYLGAPESLQGAVAAGLLGAGDHFLGTMQNTAQMLQEEIDSLTAGDSPAAFSERAREVVRASRQARRIIPGLGHPIHTHGDPRVPVLRSIAGDNGFDGKHWSLLAAIEEAFKTEFGKYLPINGAGAIGATVSDMGLEPVWARAFALIGRSAGLLAHLMDEQRAPLGQKIWNLVLAHDDSAALAGKS